MTLNKKVLAATSAAAAATAVTGSIASTEVKSAWYARLDKPPIQPPGAVFGAVWTLLYSDIAITSAVALSELGSSERGHAYRKALAVNLVLNTSWSWTFFKFHRLLPAVVVAGALAGSSVGLVRRTWAADRRAGAALLPYAGWCSFATVLSAALWRRNR